MGPGFVSEASELWGICTKYGVPLSGRPSIPATPNRAAAEVAARPGRMVVRLRRHSETSSSEAGHRGAGGSRCLSAHDDDDDVDAGGVRAAASRPRGAHPGAGSRDERGLILRAVLGAVMAGSPCRWTWRSLLQVWAAGPRARERPHYSNVLRERSRWGERLLVGVARGGRAASRAIHVSRRSSRCTLLRAALASANGRNRHGRPAGSAVFIGGCRRSCRHEPCGWQARFTPGGRARPQGRVWNLKVGLIASFSAFTTTRP